MPRVRITETSPIKAELHNDKDEREEWHRPLGNVRETIDWEATARGQMSTTAENGRVVGVWVDLVTIPRP